MATPMKQAVLPIAQTCRIVDFFAQAK